jgi:hypothetical protein
MPPDRKRNPKPPPTGTGRGRPKGAKSSQPKRPPVSKGILTPAEIKFAKLYAAGELNLQECAKQAGVATGTPQGTAVRVRRLLRDPRIRGEIDRFRRCAAETARIDITTLARDYSQRVRADPCDIHDPDTGKLLPIREWPKVLRRMVRKFHYDKEGKVRSVEFASTVHLDGILANWTGMIGDRLPNENAAPLTTVITIVRNGPGAPEPLALPSKEEILGENGWSDDDDGFMAVPINLPLPEGGERWTPPPESPTPIENTVEDEPRAREEMSW